jgi:predicted branched-subunit amino acid permease
MLPACVGLIPFGLVTGIGAASAGADWLGALGMSAIMFAGAAQVLAAQLFAAGAPMAVIILTCFVAGASIPASWSLEFAVPLCFLALLAPALRSAPTLLAAVVAGVAVIALQDLPMRLNLVAAGLIGIAAGTLAERGGERWTRR